MNCLVECANRFKLISLHIVCFDLKTFFSRDLNFIKSTFFMHITILWDLKTNFLNFIAELTSKANTHSSCLAFNSHNIFMSERNWKRERENLDYRTYYRNHNNEITSKKAYADLFDSPITTRTQIPFWKIWRKIIQCLWYQ